MFSALLTQALVAIESCLKVDAGQEVLLISDESLGDNLIAALRAAVRHVGATDRVMTYEPIHRYTIEQSALFPSAYAGNRSPALSRTLEAAMKAADVILFVHSDVEILVHPVLRELSQTKPILSFAYLTDTAAVRLLPSSASEVEELLTSIEKGARVMGAAKVGRIRSDEGSDLSFSFGQFPVNTHLGIARGRGLAVLPGGQVTRVPDDGSATGRLVVDRTISAYDYKMLDEPITLIVEHGRVVRIEGGLDARRLDDWLRELDPNKMYHLTEVSFGTNRRCSADERGYQTEDSHAWGTASVALGSDEHQGGAVKAPAHCDMTMRRAILELDGVTIVSKGRLLL